jgi:hypothetical protein
MQIIRDLFYLAREAVGCIHEGVALGLKIVRDEGPERDEITHGPKWEVFDSLPIDYGLMYDSATFTAVIQPSQSSLADGEIANGVPRVDPPVSERPEAVSDIRPSAASGHPNVDYWKLADAAVFGLRQWISGEPCTAPTYFGSIAHDLEQLSK